MPDTSPLVIVFARAPVPGRCKTRLIPARGARGAAAVHRQLTRRTLETALGSGTRGELWCAPDTQHGFLQGLRRDYGVPLQRQARGDLGRKMGLALRTACRAIVIGTDCPVLTAKDLRAALLALEHHDAVIQGAEDGGYVLLGARRPLTAALRGVDWSSGREGAQTRRRLQQAGLSLAERPTRWDVDRPQDLKKARKWLPLFRNGAFAGK